jgi:hypothetical protein
MIVLIQILCIARYNQVFKFAIFTGKLFIKCDKIEKLDCILQYIIFVMIMSCGSIALHTSININRGTRERTKNNTAKNNHKVN